MSENMAMALVSAAQMTMRHSPAKALELINQALDNAPNYYDAHFFLGIVYRQMSQPDSAKSAFRRSQELDPDQFARDAQLYNVVDIAPQSLPPPQAAG